MKIVTEGYEDTGAKEFSYTTNRIPLSEHLRTLGNREELIGLKVWDNVYLKYLYVKVVGDFALWCGANINNDAARACGISDLSIDLSEQE